MKVTRESLVSLKELYENLLGILLSESNEKVSYGVRVLKRGIAMIENGLKSDEDLVSLFTKLRTDYFSMYPPHGGMTDYFIWREDFDERIAVNTPLNSVKERIAKFYE